MAIQNGRFVNHGPMHILNFRANAASILGRSGGLPKYWDGEPDKESGNSNSFGNRVSLQPAVSNTRQEPTRQQTLSKRLLPHQQRRCWESSRHDSLCSRHGACVDSDDAG
ncbi:hypothetical protein EV127DRAFT_412313 [Xylaria flabelliformis]|nr:hypothetical protein EV127DRAFT_412313 [Xylaria flabelliformis]